MGGCTLDQVKPKVPTSLSFGEGGCTVGTTFLKYLSGGTQGVLNQKFAQPSPSGPVKINDKKDGRRRRPHRFHVFRSPLTRLLDPLLDSLSHTKCVETNKAVP